MEKTWDDFWTSGKVTDYLAYKDIVQEQEGTQRKQKDDGTAVSRDGYGFECHAH